MLLLVTIGILFTLYGALLLWYARSWDRLSIFQPGVAASVRISVVIAARNEERSIGALLDSLQNQSYPQQYTEIIVVDDHSEDQTAAIVKRYPAVRLVEAPPGDSSSYKKQALAAGIRAATGELIVTTDADCRVPPRWLETIAGFQQEKKAVAIPAPVLITGSGSLLDTFQCMDFMTLQGITGATMANRSMIMANGANLAYTRKSFDEAGGFAGIDRVASGDDMMLLYRIYRRHPGDVHYLLSRDAIVSTPAQPGWKSFLNQRKRWASKSFHYEDNRILPVLALVYLVNLVFPFLLIAGFFAPVYWLWLLGAWVIKTLVELPFYMKLARFFEKQETVKWFPLLQPLHIAYTIFIGIASRTGAYEWKGRKLK